MTLIRYLTTRCHSQTCSIKLKWAIFKRKTVLNSIHLSCLSCLCCWTMSCLHSDPGNPAVGKSRFHCASSLSAVTPKNEGDEAGMHPVSCSCSGNLGNVKGLCLRYGRGCSGSQTFVSAQDLSGFFCPASFCSFAGPHQSSTLLAQMGRCGAL